MNRAERRRIAKGAPRAARKAISVALRERDKAKWCQDCMFDKHQYCRMGNCGCPCAEQRVTDRKGNEVKDVARRRSGLYVARPKLELPK